MIECRVEITAENPVVVSGGPWAPDGVVRETPIEGGANKLVELFNNPPEECHMVSLDHGRTDVTLAVVPISPNGLRALAEALELWISMTFISRQST